MVRLRSATTQNEMRSHHRSANLSVANHNSSAKIEIEPKVANLVRIFLNHNRTGYLLVSPTNVDQPMSTNGVTRTLQRISATHFDGKKIGSSLLRHMYLSENMVRMFKIKKKIATSWDILSVCRMIISKYKFLP